MALSSKVNYRKIKHPRYKWMATFKESGAIKKKYFAREQDAKDFKKERDKEAERHGVGSVITTAERATVVDTRERLADAGISLREAVEIAIERSATLQRSCTVSELIASLLAEKEREGVSEQYMGDLKNRLGRFEQAFGNRAAAGVAALEISDWLAGLGVKAVTVSNFCRLLVLLFNHGRKLKFCTENPASESYKPKVVSGEIGILTVPQARKLLDKCDPEILPAIAIGMFAGLRDSEIKRLDWADVDLIGKFIEVKAGNAKSSRRRLVPIRPTLAAWLRPYALPQRGSVWPHNGGSTHRGRSLTDAARQAAGFGELEDGTKVEPWPSNALRHSFASYGLAHDQDAAKNQFQRGHRARIQASFSSPSSQ